MTQKRFSAGLVKLNADLEKTELPKYLLEMCTDSHKSLRAMFERCVTDLIQSESCAMSFSKQVKLIIESLDTNLKLLKGLKATEAKKFTKEVETLQAKFAKVMEIGKKANQIQTEIEGFEREKENLKRKKISYSKAKNMDLKTISDKITGLMKTQDKAAEEYRKIKEEMKQQNTDFNEAKLYIFRTFNAHSASIDMRFGDNLELYRKNLGEFCKGLKITTQGIAKDPTQGSPESFAHPAYMRSGSFPKANSVSASSDDDKAKRLVINFKTVLNRSHFRRRDREELGSTLVL